MKVCSTALSFVAGRDPTTVSLQTPLSSRPSRYLKFPVRRLDSERFQVQVGDMLDDNLRPVKQLGKICQSAGRPVRVL